MSGQSAKACPKRLKHLPDRSKCLIAYSNAGEEAKPPGRTGKAALATQDAPMRNGEITPSDVRAASSLDGSRQLLASLGYDVSDPIDQTAASLGIA